MKYIIRQKQRIVRGWNENGTLVTTPSLADATVYDTPEDAQATLNEDKLALPASGGPDLWQYEIVEVTEKELFKGKLRGK